MKFGTHTIFTIDSNLIQQRDTTYYKDVPMTHIQRSSESIKVKDEHEAHAIYLNLMDEHKAGKVKDYGIICISDDTGKIIRVEKITTQDLALKQ